MITIEFNYGQLITTIQANMSDLFQIPLNQFVQKTLILLNSVNFIANGIPIKPEQTVESQMNNLNKKDKKMTVLVDPVYISNKNEVKIQSKDIICPVCKEPCRMKIEDYHIELFKCINGHITAQIKKVYKLVLTSSKPVYDALFGGVFTYYFNSIIFSSAYMKGH